MMTAEKQPELNADMPIQEQILAQPGRDFLRLVTCQGTVTITRTQADQLLSWDGMLVIDPLTRVASVRPYFDTDVEAD